eukprot:COSAG04_NODE_18411_length_442_cov_1.183673_1_plen_41_part_01
MLSDREPFATDTAWPDIRAIETIETSRANMQQAQVPHTCMP